MPENLKQILEDPDTGPLMRITIEIALRKLAAGRELARLATAAGTQFTCFTGTKVQILSIAANWPPGESSHAWPPLLVLSLLALLVQKCKYCRNSAAQIGRRARAWPPLLVLSLLALLVQKCKYCRNSTAQIGRRARASTLGNRCRSVFVRLYRESKCICTCVPVKQVLVNESSQTWQPLQVSICACVPVKQVSICTSVPV
jgi:hypothetical protein